MAKKIKLGILGGGEDHIGDAYSAQAEANNDAECEPIHS